MSYKLTNAIEISAADSFVERGFFPFVLWRCIHAEDKGPVDLIDFLLVHLADSKVGVALQDFDNVVEPGHDGVFAENQNRGEAAQQRKHGTQDAGTNQEIRQLVFEGAARRMLSECNQVGRAGGTVLCVYTQYKLPGRSGAPALDGSSHGRRQLG